MKNVRVTTAIMVMAFIGLTSVSCNDGKKNTTPQTKPSVEKEHQAEAKSKTPNPDAKRVVADYMVLKNALVATDETAAAAAAQKLVNSVKEFDASTYSSENQNKLKEIMAFALDRAERIGNSEMAQQREQFQGLTDNVMAMVTITGTDKTLYQQFCPMYADNGGAWLSMEKEIKNPYFGDKMMKCGEVQQEIN